MSVILAACSGICSDRFEIMQHSLATINIQAKITQCQCSSRIDCSGMKFALVGIMGHSDERQCGLEALVHIAQRCKSISVGIFFDAMGFQWYSMQHGTPSPIRIRMAVFAGSPSTFPHASAMIQVKAPKIFVPGDEWNTEKKAEIVETIKEIVNSRSFCF